MSAQAHKPCPLCHDTFEVYGDCCPCVPIGIDGPIAPAGLDERMWAGIKAELARTPQVKRLPMTSLVGWFLIAGVVAFCGLMIGLVRWIS